MKNILYSGLLMLALGTSCEKKDSIPVRFTPVVGTNANVKFLALSPDAPGFNFYVNNIKSSSAAPTTSNNVTGIAYPSIFPATIGYATIPSGSIQVEAKVPDSSAVMPGETISTSTHSLTANSYYTLALVDSMSNITTVLLTDDPTIGDATKAYFRIANFVSNGNAIKVEVAKTTGSTYPFPVVETFTVNFKEATNFQAFPDQSTYRIYLKDANTDNKLDSISAFTPTVTKKYTIYARGVHGLTGTNTRRPIITSYINF